MGVYYPLLLLLLRCFNAIAYTFVSVLCLRRLRARMQRGARPFMS